MTQLSLNALTVLESRYLLKDGDGKIRESPEELFRRVSVFISQGESAGQRSLWEQKFFDLMSSLIFLPNSPTLMNAGTDHGQLSACYVLPVHHQQDMADMTLTQALEIQKSGGGTGFNFSPLSSDEAVAYIGKFNKAMDTIRQMGKRSGANMAILNIDHPAIETFIHSKTTGKALSNFNISVGITDDFMQALSAGLLWPLKDPVTGRVIREVPASYLWQAIVHAAWRTGDPGLVFLDAMERDNPTPGLGPLKATNPCGEVPLLSYEACNLGSINLSLMTKREGRRVRPDWEKLREVIPVCIRFLDNVIEVNYYVIPEINNIVRGNRKIGLGVMGWTEMLVKLGIRYDSEEAIMLGKKMMRFIREESLKASQALAEEKGSFPHWEQSKFYPHRPMRNATVNSIAPTGTISIIAHTSSSIEPFFALYFMRSNVLNGVDLYEMNPLLEAYMGKYPSHRDAVEAEIRKKGYFSGEDKVPGILKDLFKTSLQIPSYYHLKHQAAFQKYTDNAVSKTINLPAEATVEEVDRVYRSAWKMGLKGITIYRYGSKDHQVLYQGADRQEVLPNPASCKLCVE